MGSCLIDVQFAVITLLLCVCWQCSLAQDGFISIGCSWMSRSYNDSSTGIKWTSDSSLINNMGECETGLTEKNLQVRVFEEGIKNCYTLSTSVGQQYLIRGTFYYGNYDQKSKPPIFDVSIGATLVFRVSTSQDAVKSYEMIVTATDYNISYCLIRIPDGGTPLIRTLELRPLGSVSYFQEKSSAILRKLMRIDCGGRNSLPYRYPDDPFDRIWDMDKITSFIRAKHPLNATYEFMVPGVVMGTAAYARERLEIISRPEDDAAFDYYVLLYFMELDNHAEIGQRVFDVYGNGVLYWKNFDILSGMNSSRVRMLKLLMPYTPVLNISLVASPSSSLPPCINAFEIYQSVPTSLGTREMDVEALLVVKDAFNLLDWSGDPCLPLSGGTPTSWTGLTCSSDPGSSTVLKLNLSSMGLKGSIPTAINGMINLQELVLSENKLAGYIPDLSLLSNLTTLQLQNNELTGTVPSSLAELPKLQILYLQNNKLTGDVPPLLLWKTMKGKIDFRYYNTSLSIPRDGMTSPPNTRAGFNHQFKALLGGFIGGSIFLLLVVVAVTYICLRKRQAKVFSTETNKVFYSFPKYIVKTIPEPQEDELKSIHIQQFSLLELNAATNDFSNRIGEGGFGAVYHGILPDGLAVAVKVRSANSIQGIREFTTELHLLSEIRHENLVPLVGYCRDQQSLVYPYMSNGSLQDRLYGEAARRKPLDWQTRLNIALGAARGLNFLHTGGIRCIIHRDVKSSNILLDNSMVAKVADFGFSKYAPQEGDSMVSLEVRGTAGYLDPEYYATQQLTVKSDVFSFGVVLLEIICGREPLNIHRPRPEWSLVEWARPFIQESNVQAIVDPAISSSYTPEAMWRVVEVALSSVESLGARRPTMADIVRELEDALIIETNASQYMASIESIASFRMSLSDTKMPPTLPLFYQFDPSPVFSETMGSPDPR